MLYLWIVAIVILLIFESVTSRTVIIWFEIGAVAGLIACTSGFPFAWQCVIFALISAFAVIDTRHFSDKFVKKDFSPANAERCLGEIAFVIEDIDNILERGAVRINGAIWTARSADGMPIEKDCSVKIERIDGINLIVRR